MEPYPNWRKQLEWKARLQKIQTIERSQHTKEKDHMIPLATTSVPIQIVKLQQTQDKPIIKVSTNRTFTPGNTQSANMNQNQPKTQKSSREIYTAPAHRNLGQQTKYPNGYQQLEWKTRQLQQIQSIQRMQHSREKQQLNPLPTTSVPSYFKKLQQALNRPVIKISTNRTFSSEKIQNAEINQSRAKTQNSSLETYSTQRNVGEQTKYPNESMQFKSKTRQLHQMQSIKHMQHSKEKQHLNSMSTITIPNHLMKQQQNKANLKFSYDRTFSPGKTQTAEMNQSQAKTQKSSLETYSAQQNVGHQTKYPNVSMQFKSKTRQLHQMQSIQKMQYTKEKQHLNPMSITSMPNQFIKQQQNQNMQMLKFSTNRIFSPGKTQTAVINQSQAKTQNSSRNTYSAQQNVGQQMKQIVSKTVWPATQVNPASQKIVQKAYHPKNLDKDPAALSKRNHKASLKPPKQRRWKVNPRNEDWASNGYYRTVFKKLKEENDDEFFAYTRMNKSLFTKLHTRIANKLRRARQRIRGEERLSITLRHLARAENMAEIAKIYMLGKTTIRVIVLQTCEILWATLAPEYMASPTQDKYNEIANDFFTRCGVPHCIGLLDWKVISYKCADQSGFKGKKLVLAAIGDSNYQFSAFHVCDDWENKPNLFKDIPHCKAILKEELPIPPDRPLPNTSIDFPHYFVGNTSFPFRSDIMQMYSGDDLNTKEQNFNTRLSRVHSVIENSFGVLTARWEVLRVAPEWSFENYKTIILACVILHNFLLQNDNEGIYCPKDFVDAEDGSENKLEKGWRAKLAPLTEPLPSLKHENSFCSYEAPQLRDKLADYLSTADAIANTPNTVGMNHVSSSIEKKPSQQKLTFYQLRQIKRARQIIERSKRILNARTMFQLCTKKPLLQLQTKLGRKQDAQYDRSYLISSNLNSQRDDFMHDKHELTTDIKLEQEITIEQSTWT